jgi:hypothetical protein
MAMQQSIPQDTKDACNTDNPVQGSRNGGNGPFQEYSFGQVRILSMLISIDMNVFRCSGPMNPSHKIESVAIKIKLLSKPT